jgi:RNA polymerase sigma-70 factor (ECF subfamily)
VGPDRDLSEALGRGDPAAEREVRGWVRTFLASRALRIPADARRDIEQEVMVEVWQAVRRPGFDVARELGGFVRVVTGRRSIDWIRGARPLAEIPAEARAPGPDPLQAALRDEERRLARRALRELPPGCRELVRMQAVERLAYRDIARLLGRTEGALRVQMHRCVERLRIRLSELAEATPPREEQA